MQEACATWVAERWYETQRDVGVTSQNVPGTISQTWGASDPMNPPPRVRALLAPYRRHTVETNQG